MLRLAEDETLEKLQHSLHVSRNPNMTEKADWKDFVMEKLAAKLWPPDIEDSMGINLGATIDVLHELQLTTLKK